MFLLGLVGGKTGASRKEKKLGKRRNQAPEGNAADHFSKIVSDLVGGCWFLKKSESLMSFGKRAKFSGRIDTQAFVLFSPTDGNLGNDKELEGGFQKTILINGLKKLLGGKTS